eukprot:s4244_g1.t2
MALSDDRRVNDPLQTQALSEDLQLRNDTLKVEVQISHNELQKQKIARQLLEEKLRTLECQLLDSTEQVQKALKDMEELAAANGAAKAMEQLPTAENEVDEGMEPTTQDMLELQQSNEAVKALLKKFCDDFRRQRAERDDFEAKLRSDELKILLQHFALHTAANLKAEAAIQAVLNDLEALKASKDLEVAIASFMGDAKATVAAKAQETLLGQALPESLAPNSAGSEAAAAPVDVPRTVAARRYDLKEPHAFAQFLQDANIRLIRAKYLNDLARSKRPLPRRQEAEESALVSHEEVQNWAKGARTATICSVSHAWETREHPDPCRYQLELIVDRAVWYEAAFETEALATSQVVSLELLNPQPGSGAFMGKAVVEALTTNQSLTSINAEDESIFDLAAKKAWLKQFQLFQKVFNALAKALRKNRSIKERLPFDAPVRLKAVAQALERNSFTNITMDPEYDQVGDEEVKAVAQLLKTGTSVKRIDLGDTCISDDGAQALAEALRCNQILEELWLHKDQITDVGAEALAEALKVNKTLRSLTVEASWEALRAVEEMKRDRGDNFQFISTEQKEAERCNGSIFQAARDGKVGAVRHLLRTKPTSVQETDLLGDTPLHDAARNGKAKVVELLLAANAPLDVKSKSGNTPMHSAAANGKAAVVELLLAANAPLEVQNKNGETPLHEAAQYGHAEVVQLLLKAEAQVDVQSNNGQTPWRRWRCKAIKATRRCTGQHATAKQRWWSCCSRPMHRWMCRTNPDKLRWTWRARTTKAKSSSSSKPPKPLHHGPRTNEAARWEASKWSFFLSMENGFTVSLFWPNHFHSHTANVVYLVRDPGKFIYG